MHKMTRSGVFFRNLSQNVLKIRRTLT